MNTAPGFPSCGRGRRVGLVTTLLFGLLASACGQEAAPGAERIAAELQPFVENRVLSGAVTLVANKETILSLVAVGYADVGAKKAMRTDDIFWIASMSKPITAAAVMMLVDEGKLLVDDPVEKYLPEFKGQMVIAEKDATHQLLRKPKRPIAIRDLLSHTSGMSFRSGIEEPVLDLYPLEARVRSYAMMPLEFEPGTKYQYANSGINTAGRIVEVISGLSFEDFLEQRLFRPLDMRDSTFRPTEAQVERIAKSYKGNHDNSDIVETPIHQLHYPLHDQARGVVPGGGLFSTATDIAHFCQMVLNGGVYAGRRLLSETSVKAMTTRQTAESTSKSYGFGFQTNGAKYGHLGAYNTNLSIDSRRGLITVFMVQNAGWRSPDGTKIHGKFYQMAMELFGR